MRRFAIVSVILAIAVVLAAPVSAAPLGDADLQAAALTSEAMPDSGWTPAGAGTSESDPRTQENDIEHGWCGGATDGYTAGELHITGSAKTILSKVVTPDEPYWFVWEQLWSFDSTTTATAVSQAKSFMATNKQVIGECADGWQTAGGGDINYAITPEVVPWPKVGKQRLAVKLITAGDGVTDTTYVVYVRVANNVLSIHSRILPPDDALLKKIVKRAAKLLKNAG